MRIVKRSSWRRRYIRLLTEPVTSETKLTTEDFQAIADLIKNGYLRGTAQYDAAVGQFTGAVIEGVTLNGYIFAEEQREMLRSKSWWGRLKSSSTIFIGWLSGIISAVIVYYLTRK
jgi:hypothetical protein